MNRAIPKRPLKANRQDGDVTLRGNDSGLILSDIVALNDAGQLDPLLPPITTGTCGWCREHGLVRDLNGFLCKTCISITFELIRAAVADDANAYAVLEKKIDFRKRIAGETVH
jgi:hypothetical protein